MVVATIFSFKHFLYAPLTTGVATVAIATNHHFPQKRGFIGCSQLTL
jgi:hypothetical protein